MKNYNLSLDEGNEFIKNKISIVNIFILWVLLMVYVFLIVTLTQNTINLLTSQTNLKLWVSSKFNDKTIKKCLI